MTTSITIYSHSVTIQTKDGILLNHIHKFLDNYYTLKQRSFGNKDETTSKLFAGKVKNQGIYQLHKRQFIHLYQYLKEIHYPLQDVEKVDHSSYKIQPAKFKVRDGWKLRPDQEPVYEFLLNNPTGSKLVPLATGSGKTAVSLITLGTIKKRLGIVILPTYIDKWTSDIVQIHEAKATDVMVVQGSKALRGIISMAKDGELKHDYIIFSNRTLQEYINTYEEDPEFCADTYGCTPLELFPLLGIGVMLIDETHQHYHSIFMILIHTNVEFQIGLSATLVSDDHVTRRLYRVMYPNDCIYGDGVIPKYTDMYPIAYSMQNELRKFVKTSNFGSSTYSHTAFEVSIIKRGFLIDRYKKLINTTIQDYYVPDYQAGDKLLIFVATIQLATILAGYLGELYPDKVVNRYCEDDPYENLINSDIIISTQQSAGTAVDIPNLRVVIQTVSVSSIQANIQNFGRLRKLKDRDTKYCYLYCNNIPKQKDYHMRRVELFRDRAASIVYRQSRCNM